MFFKQKIEKKDIFIIPKLHTLNLSNKMYWPKYFVGLKKSDLVTIIGNLFLL